MTVSIPTRKAQRDSVSALAAICIATLPFVLGCAVMSVAVSTPAFAALTITPATLPNGYQYVPYSYQVTASGGTGTLTWSISSGTLPSGLTLSSAGLLSGRETAATASTFTVAVQDQSGNPAVAEQYTITPEGIQQAVDGLSTSTQAEAVKKAVLEWGLAEAPMLGGNDATNLFDDVGNDFYTAFTLPTSLDSTYFPAIPDQANNQMYLGAATNSYNYIAYDASHQSLIAYPPTTGNPTYDTNVDAPNADANVCGELIRGFIYPNPHQYDPGYVASILSRYQNFMSTRGTGGAFDGDFTSAAEAPYLYLLMQSALPQMMLPSRAAAWKTALTQDQTAITNLIGAQFTAQASNLSGQTSKLWINRDVRLMSAIGFTDVVTATPTAHATELTGAMAEMTFALQGDGGTNYTDTQNEAQSYHYYYVENLERFGRVMGATASPAPTYASDAAATYPKTLNFTLLEQTEPVPSTVSPPTVNGKSIGEWVTAPSWHKYWDENNNLVAMVEAFGAPVNQSSSDPNVTSAVKSLLAQIQNEGWPHSWFLAPFWSSQISSGTLTPTPVPSSYILSDLNIQGTRGVKGPWAYMSTTRTTPYSQRGKTSYVGSMLLTPYTNATAANYPLDSAVEAIGTQVLKAAGAGLNPYQGNEAAYNPSNVVDAANEYNATMTTSTFGSLTTVHNLSGYEGASTSWQETETWVLLPTRIIGLVQVTNTADETANALQGVVRFVSGSSTWGPTQTLAYSNGIATFGNTVVQVFYNTFGGAVSTAVDNTYQDNGGKAAYLYLPSSLNPASGTTVFPAGTSAYFMAEIRPNTSPSSAGTIGKYFLGNGLVSFRFTDNGVQYQIVHNPTNAAVAYTPTAGTTQYNAGTSYRGFLVNGSSVDVVPYSGTIAAHSHMVFTTP